MASRNDYFKLHFIVFLWGFSGILGKLISIPAIELVIMRFMLAAIGMYALIVFRKESLNVTRVDFVKLILIGFIVSLHWLAFFWSARISNVSVSLVGFATNSLWTALLEPLFNKTRIKKFELFLGCLVIVGLYIIFSFDFKYKLGLLVAVSAGFTSALFSILNSKMVKRVNPKTITLYKMCGGFIASVLFFALYQAASETSIEIFETWPSLYDWIFISLLAGVCSIYAYTAAIELMKKVSVFMIQLTLNLEPLYGIVMAIIIFGETERMSANFYMGTFVILCAVLSYPFVKKRFDQTALID
jgi:drug/metabolite transporter (DMT)-like permease